MMNAGESLKSGHIISDNEKLSPAQLSAMGADGLQCGGGRTLLPRCINLDAMSIHSVDGVEMPPNALTQVSGNCWYLRRNLTLALPFENGVFQWAYSEHFIEHITFEHAVKWLVEVRRVLREGGLLRISTPDLAKYMQGYNESNGRFFEIHQSRLTTMGVKTQSRKAWMVNQIFRFWGHQWVYDWKELCFALESAGFDRANILQFGFRDSQSTILGAFDREIRSDESLYVEAKV